jgi:hypothetical protein
MATLHAKNRPPSAAHRWLPCPFSATVAPLYDRDETDASLKGDLWHKGMEDLITFGTLPLTCDPDMADTLADLYDYVVKRFKEAGPGAKLFVEQQLDIPETGEFGTADVIIVSDLFLEVDDEKSGYVPVNVKHNDQLMTYLLGAIAKYGPRPKYRLGVHQPNFDHVDGPLRFWEPTDDDIAEFRLRVLDSMANPERISAGKHCKDTYCDHRGACAAFADYARNDLSLGWHTSELKGMSDDTLAAALDASDELGGWRTELRAEAMRRIVNMDRKIEGYKVVKGRRNRAVSDAAGLIRSVVLVLGDDWAVRMFDPGLAWASAVIRTGINSALPTGIPQELLKSIGTPKHIEEVLKQYARQHKLPRGAWEKLYDNVVGEYIRETANGLTLERAIDGRPAHKRGSEFGVIDPANSPTLTTVL